MIHSGNVAPSNQPARLPLPANAVQNLADILSEGCRFPRGKSEIDEEDLVFPLEAVKRNLIWVLT
jgi:hypothetical protein